MADPIRLTVEATGKRAFATAVDWPGWSRSGKTEVDALAALAAAADRYAEVAAAAGVDFPGSTDRVYDVIERVTGGAGTDFGAPGQVTEAERQPVSQQEAARAVALLEAAWAALDAIAAAAPEELRNGPRGGGRDRTKIVGHVTESDQYYARAVGVRVPAFPVDDRAAHASLRAAMAAALRTPSDGSPLAGRRWPHRHAANYIAWHALDHAWEMLDRADPGSGPG